MNSDEFAIYDYLKPRTGEFVGGEQICRKADGYGRYASNPGWATPTLGRLVEEGKLETDGLGRYRVSSEKAPAKSGAVPRWICPKYREILEQHGRLPRSESSG